MPAHHSTLFHRVIRGHRKERRIRFLPLNVRQYIGRIAKSRITPLAHHHHLQVIGVPVFGGNRDWFFISHLSRRDRAGNSCTLRAHSRDRLRAQVFLFQVAVRIGFLHPVPQLFLERASQPGHWFPDLHG